MHPEVAVNDIGPGYSAHDLDSFDDDAELDRIYAAPTEAKAPVEPEPEIKAPAEAKTEAEPEDKAAPVEPEAKAEDPEAQAEGTGEDDEGGPPPGKRKEFWLPKSRYDFAQAKRREAESALEQARRENAELQQRIAERGEAPQVDLRAEQAAELETKLADLDKQVEQARLDGNTERAAQLAAEIRATERQLFASPEINVDEIRAQAAEQARASLLFDQTVAALESKYPVLDPNSSQFDENLVDEVGDLYNAFKQRYDRLTALNRAVGYVVAAHDLGDEALPVESKEAPRPRTTDIKRNVDAAKSIPPDVSGFDSDKAGPSRSIDPSRMTIEEFERLSDEDEERLLA